MGGVDDKGGEVVNGKAREPNYKIMSDWLVAVYSNMHVEIGRKSCKKAEV